MQTVLVKHNVEMAHRLQLPGKCQNIHGHTWSVTLEIADDVNESGIIIDFHALKSMFRGYLDSNFDHKLCLSSRDPWLGQLRDRARTQSSAGIMELYPPGLIMMDEDPTTENFAKWVGQAMRRLLWDYPHGPNRIFRVTVEEGLHNGATWEG